MAPNWPPATAHDEANDPNPEHSDALKDDDQKPNIGIGDWSPPNRKVSLQHLEKTDYKKMTILT